MATTTWFPRPGGLSLTTDEADAYAAHVERAARASAEDSASRERETARKRELHAEAIDRFQIILEAEADQREREAADLRFARGLPEDQWPEDVRRNRKGGVIGGRVVAERPCLVIDKTAQPVQQVVAEARQARLGIEVKPKGRSASAEGAELRQGMIRSIEVDSNAPNARLWALERAVKCGRGYYRVMYEYANDGDFDLDLRVVRIANQGTVYCDPHASLADWSDMEYAFITEDLTRAEYLRTFGREAPQAASATDLESATDVPEGWIEDDTVRVAEYFYVVHRTRTLIEDPATGQTVFKDEWPDDVPVPPGAKQRPVDDRQVRWCVLDATDVLDEQEWMGRYIPIVFLPGKEDVVEGERCWRGMIGPSKDSQRLYNFMVSAQAEAVGLAPKAPWLLAEGQIEGYEELWATANITNFPYLIWKPTSFEGTALPPPQRNVAEPAIQAVSLAIQQAANDIKATTGRFDPSLGNLSGERSGKAIEALKLQGEMSSSLYLDNLAQVAMMHEARILLDLLPKVYDRPGRVVRLLGESPEDEKQILLGVPFVPGPNGLPQPVSGPQMGPMPPGPGMSPPAPSMPGPTRPTPEPQTYQLDPDEDYAVQVTVGRAFATEREANLQFLSTVLETTQGQAAPLIMDLYAEQLGGPVGRKLAERFRAANPTLAGEAQSGLSPYAQAQIGQMQQQMQQMQQALQQAQMELQTQAAKAQVDLERAKLERASAERIAQLQAQVEMTKTRATIQNKEALAMLDAEQARIEAFVDRETKTGLERVKGDERRKDLVLGAALQSAQGEDEAQRERVAQHEDRAFEADREDRAAFREERMGEREHARTKDLATFQARLAPKPAKESRE